MLAYSNGDETEQTIQRTLPDCQGLAVIRAAEEPDAPPHPDTSGLRPSPRHGLLRGGPAGKFTKDANES
jgi:hypothetical protein